MIESIRLKLFIDPDDVQWVAVAVHGTPAETVVVLMRDDKLARSILLTTDEWNDLPHYRFENKGPAPKTPVVYKPEE